MKSETMASFTANQTKLLVSTTVIEVGVDVHNATLMVILDADRFGISQLHQLRGRVGRGGLPGTCLLVTTLEPGHPSRRRLDAVAATTDGFELSPGGPEAAPRGRHPRRLPVRRPVHAEAAASAGARGHHCPSTAGRPEDRRCDPGLAGYTALAEAIDEYLNPEKEAFLERG